MKSPLKERGCLALGAAGLALSLITAAAPISAQDFPSKPVRMIAPFAPGGGADIAARRLAQRLNALWKQPVIVQNIAGAAGNLAAATTANSVPDGYTLLFASLPIFVNNPAMYDKLPFDPDRDFAPVILVADTPHVLLVSSAFRAANVRELIAMGKEKPGSLNFGSGGQGTSLHLAGELFKVVTGIDMVHVPYKGAAPAIAAMLGDDIQMLFDNASSSVIHIRAGRTRGLGVASPTRSGALPEVPTFDESGVPNFHSGIQHGIFVRAGTPPATVAAINRAINTVFKEPDYRKQLTGSGVNVAGGTPGELAAFIVAERKKWVPIIRKQGLKAQ